MQTNVYMPNVGGDEEMKTNDTVTRNDAIWQTEFGEAWDDDDAAGCAGEGMFAHRAAEVIYMGAGIVLMLGIWLISIIVIADFLNIV